MRQLQTVIDGDKRHQRALRLALSEQEATLKQQQAEALIAAEQLAAAAQAAAVADLQQQLDTTQQRALAAEEAVAGMQQRLSQAEDAASKAAQTNDRVTSARDELQMQLQGTQDQLIETQQRLQCAEKQHAEEAELLCSQLAAAQEQQLQHTDGLDGPPSAAGKSAADEAALAAAIQQRQQALGAEFEQAMQRLEQRLQEQHAAEIASLEQVQFGSVQFNHVTNSLQSASVWRRTLRASLQICRPGSM
jgi:chromosome segregation ATPase